MIESIEIKNFRCFKDTKIAKFGLINLFGGKNNAGKTALLEAIFLTESPNSSSIMFSHRVVRKEESAFIKEMPKNAWDNLFLQQNKNEEISLISINNEAMKSRVALSCDEEVDDLVSFIDEESEDNEISQIHLALSAKDAVKSALHLKVYLNDEERYTSILVASKSGIVGKGSSGIKIDNANFIPASLSLSTSSLAEEYDKARFNDKGKVLLDAFQVIDKTIENVDIFAIGKPTLYLKRKNENRMPIGLFGDAINKIANFILSIINNPNSVILIDEIENGIHCTNQEELWKMLFKLAIEYKVQIFATSHSLEMIRAFSEVADTPEFLERAAYFEMARHYKTGNIIGTSIPIDILKYNIMQGSSYRGEPI